MTQSSPQLLLALLADARLPTGSHAQSAGLEPAVLGGLTGGGERLEEVPAYARVRLRTVTATEAGVAVVTRSVRLDGRPLEPVLEAWAARTPSAAIRRASRRLGRGYLRLARALWPELDGAFAEADPPRPAVLGVVAAVTGLPPRDLALLVAYDDVQAIASAALKLVPLDPVQATRWVLDLQGDMEALAGGVEHLTDAAQIPAGGAPVIDADAEHHATSTRRLFHA